ncbi:fimbrial protein, partial [uncultured Duncaniella sp.]|uniref:fimbrial protein n=1 Tax=uncultured Duncaniella sp. TaxID=2768039 RepID=UPI002659B44E
MITLTSISANLRRLAATMTVLTALLGLLASCSDELSGPDVPQDGAPGLSLRLNLPTASALGEAGNPDSPIFQATAEECRVNSLRFFAFPVDGNGDFVSETLDPSRDFTHERWQNYQIEITPGNYHVYVVANLDVSDVMNEAALKAKILRYRNGDEAVLPVAGNIPMIYEPQGDNAIVVIDKTQTELSASLQFTCVKVDLNLIFDIDNEATKAQFGNHRLRLTAINGKKLSEATTLVWGGDYSARPAGKGKESFEVENVSVGKYFTSWTRTDENAGVTDKTVINDLDGESSDNKSQLDKWLFRSTLYLPERYVATDGEQSELEVEGELLDEEGNPIDIRTKFMIPLGHGKTEEDVRVCPRSTYYEIIGDIVS